MHRCLCHWCCKLEWKLDRHRPDLHARLAGAARKTVASQCQRGALVSWCWQPGRTTLKAAALTWQPEDKLRVLREPERCPQPKRKSPPRGVVFCGVSRSHNKSADLLVFRIGLRRSCFAMRTASRSLTLYPASSPCHQGPSSPRAGSSIIHANESS